jgi:hypothetical protein
MDAAVAAAVPPVRNPAADPMSITLTRAEPSSAMDEQEPQPRITLTEQQLRARRSRSLAIALALGAFVLVIFVVTMVKLSSGTMSGGDYMRPAQTTK